MEAPVTQQPAGKPSPGAQWPAFVDWRDFSTRAFAQENVSIRVRAAGSFRFIPFADVTARGLVLLKPPAVTAIGFETYFVASLLQSTVEGDNRVGPLLASIAWFALSVGLGISFCVGVMAIGHGGGSNI